MFRPNQVLLIAVLLFFSILVFSACGSNEREQPEKITFGELVEQQGEEKVLSERAKELKDKTVTVEGWMSPLSPFRENYFYLINTPSESCPFCAGEEVNHFDIIVVQLKDEENYRFTYSPIRVTGVLDVSFKMHDLHAASYFRIQVNDVNNIERINVN